MDNEEQIDRIKNKLVRELGPQIEAALKNPDIIEVMLNPDGELWFEEFGKPMKRVGTFPASKAMALIATIATSLKTIANKDNPIVEGELITDGSRFEGVIPPVVKKPAFTIRKKAERLYSLSDYVKQGIMTELHKTAICKSINNRENILIVGGTGSGKTTLANAIIDQITIVSPNHRVVVLEDTAEIQCKAKNSVIMRTTDNINMRKLLKTTMRMRPDRIIVGEARGGEALDLLKAWNTGHPGGTATIHANDGYAGLIRMEQLIAEAVEKPQHALIAEAIDLVVCINKTAEGRKITEIIEVTGFSNNQYQIHKKFTMDQTA